jgi:GTP-binding protein LepA
MDKIRNFSIIAHVDHGKSTLSDKLIEFTHTVSVRDLKDQYLDNMDLERERGITIKLQTIMMEYKGYRLNLIDTPGHVDFSGEVARSLMASDGALLLVDVMGGIEAQTLGNYLKALDLGIPVIPILNKVDIENIDIEKSIDSIVNILGFDKNEIILASGKSGIGIEKILDTIIEKIPAPSGDINKSFRGFIFDSFFDEYKGVVLLVKILDGSLKISDKIYFSSNAKEITVLDIGHIAGSFIPQKSVSVGEVVYIATGLKSIKDVVIKDTLVKDLKSEPLFPITEEKSMVFSSIYPIDSADIEKFRDSVEKLSINDASFNYTPCSNSILGFGYRCGFLGLLHMDIIKERLSREYNIDIFVSFPSVEYKMILKNTKEEVLISQAQDLIDESLIDSIEEPYVRIDIIVPKIYFGVIMEFVLSRRGEFINSSFYNSSINLERTLFNFDVPLSSVIYNFFDELKSISSGEASMDYSFVGFRKSDIKRLDFLINHELVDPLSILIHTQEAEREAKSYVSKMKDIIPRKNFSIAIQATLDGKIIAREDVKPFRKDVTQKLYGGDPTRRMKLLEKQKKGKKKSLMFGKVEIPSDLFIKLYSQL